MSTATRITPRVITRTIIGSRLLATLQQQKPYVHVDNTTLNEALGINDTIRPNVGETPVARYYAIGMGGHVNRVGSDGGHYPVARKHRPDDFGLYQQLPFVIRELGDDLTPQERSRYGLRKIIDHPTRPGERYIAYYLKRIDIDDSPVQMNLNTTVNGVTTTVPFVPTNANLFPTPVEPTSVNVNTTDGTTLTTSSLVAFEFDAQDSENLMEVAEVLYGGVERALISEIAYVAGCDRVVSVNDGTNPFNMNEVVEAQIVTHITGLWPVAYASSGFSFKLDMGGTEPMVGISTENPITPPTGP